MAQHVKVFTEYEPEVDSEWVFATEFTLHAAPDLFALLLGGPDRVRYELKGSPPQPSQELYDRLNALEVVSVTYFSSVDLELIADYYRILQFSFKVPGWIEFLAVINHAQILESTGYWVRITMCLVA